jgi:hypothetical protein
LPNFCPQVLDLLLDLLLRGRQFLSRRRDLGGLLECDLDNLDRYGDPAGLQRGALAPVVLAVERPGLAGAALLALLMGLLNLRRQRARKLSA